MPNTNYIRGRKAEYDLMDWLRQNGWLVIRSAGSHSPVDVVAGKLGFPVTLYQVKSGDATFTFEEAEALREYARAYRARAVLAHKIKGHKVAEWQFKRTWEP